MSTDSNGVDVSNSYVSSLPDIPVAAKLISNKRYQNVIPTDNSGNAYSSTNPFPIGPSGSTAVSYQKGKIAGTSLTTSYQTVVTPSSDVKAIWIYNSTDVAILISVDAGSSEFVELDAYEDYQADLQSLGFKITAAAIQTKLVGSTAGTIGSVRCQIFR